MSAARTPPMVRIREAPATGVTVARVPVPFPELNRFFYGAVGGPYFWIDRLSWPLEKWREWVEQPGLDTYVMAVDGIPAGYFELLREKLKWGER